MEYKRIRLYGLTIKALLAVALLGIALPARSEEIIASQYGTLLVTAPVAVALERGEFTKQGVNITGVIASPGGGTAMRNVMASGVPYGEVSVASAIAAINQGADIVIVNASDTWLADLIWVVLPNSSLKSIKDIPGKRLGVANPKSSTELMAFAAVAAAGIPRDSVKLVAMGTIGSGLTALQQGGIDAAPILEPLYSAREEQYRVLFDLDNLPKAITTVGVTTLTYAKANPENVRKIVAARRAAVDFIYSNPEEAARMIAKRYGSTLPAEVAIKAVKRMVAKQYWSRGEFDWQRLENTAELLRQSGQLEGPVDWKKVVDTSFLPPDLRNK